MPQAIGVFGGTFAPIHNGHLRLASAARDQLNLSKVLLIPAAQPPLRLPPAISGERRLRWVRLAIQNEPRLIADDRELKRAGPSYTVDTLAGLRAEFPRTPLCLLLGQDAVMQLPQWHRWESLLDYAHLVFFNRPGVAGHFSVPLARVLREREAHDPAELHRALGGLWWRCEIPPSDISASAIRASLRSGTVASVKGLIPAAVIHDFTPSDLEAFAQNENEAVTAH